MGRDVQATRKLGSVRYALSQQPNNRAATYLKRIIDRQIKPAGNAETLKY